jgi:hypothetical protein
MKNEELKTLHKGLESIIRKRKALIKDHEAGKIEDKDAFDKRLREINEEEKQVNIMKRQIEIKDEQRKTKNKQINTKKKELDIVKAELGGKEEQIKYLEKNLIFYVKTGLIGLTFGIFLSIVGFILWYRRIQRYQDAILKDQYREAIKPK